MVVKNAIQSASSILNRTVKLLHTAKRETIKIQTATIGHQFLLLYKPCDNLQYQLYPFV